MEKTRKRIVIITRVIVHLHSKQACDHIKCFKLAQNLVKLKKKQCSDIVDKVTKNKAMSNL